MWILLWLVLSSVLIGASIWSFQILHKQKKAWQAYAKGKNFTYTGGTLMGSPEMNGVIGDFKIGFFTAERDGADVRTRKLVTVLEIEMIDGLVDGGVVGTSQMLPFMQTLNTLHPFKQENLPLEEGQYMFVRNDSAIKAYMTPERGDAIHNVLKTRNADVILIFNDKQALVRLETGDPMQDPDKIDKIVKRVIALLEKIRITPEQREAYMKAA